MGMVEKMAMAMDAAVLRYILDHEEKAKNDPTIIPWIGMADVPMDILARAAIEAMREPTDEMWAAAWLIHHPWGVNAPDPRDRPNAFDAMKEKTSAILAAMIDKALESGE